MADPAKTLLITSTGLVGSNLARVFASNGSGVIGTYYPVLEQAAGYPADITDPASVNGLFAKTKPSIAILSAALTNVEYCQEHQDEAWRINVAGTRNVANACREHGCRLVFFSSDYVFNGNAGPYTEDDAPHPICFYGETKLEGESVVRSASDDHLIIRTTIVFGSETAEKNFCYRLINALKRRDQVAVPRDQVGTPTYAHNLASIVHDLCKKNVTGLYNVVGADLVDRYEFALRVCDVFGLDRSLVIPVLTGDLHQKAPRPLKAGLRIDKVRRVTSIQITGVADSLAAFKKEIDGQA